MNPSLLQIAEGPLVSIGSLPPSFPARDQPVPHPIHIHAPSPGATATLLHDCFVLFKVRVVTLVLVTAWGGYYLGAMHSGVSSVQRGLLGALLGIGLVSAGAGALNEALERKTDARMKRTADRPLAAGRFSLAQGVMAGMGALSLGALDLHFFANPLTTLLALLTAFAYVAVYTPLKRVTPLATFIGAFPGAMGPMLGWTAARGRIEWPGVALFAILWVWQFPHFMSIAWLYREDYARAGIRMLPVVHPDGWVHRGAGLGLCRPDGSGKPRAVAAGHGERNLCGSGCPARLHLSGLYPSLHAYPAPCPRGRKPHGGPRSAQR